MADFSLNSTLLNSSKRDTYKTNQYEPVDEAESLRNQIDKLSHGLAHIRGESSKKSEQIAELQKWTQNLIALNSSNYEVAMTKVSEGLKSYFDLKEDICELKKEIMYERRRVLVTTERYNRAKEDLNRLKREISALPAGMLFIEKSNLEVTLRQSSEEVEVLSEKNQELLDDMKIKDYFVAYEKACAELSTLRDEFNSFLKKTNLIKNKSPRKEPTNLKKLFNINCSSTQKY